MRDLHGESNISNKVCYDKVDHVMHKWVYLHHLLNDMGHLMQQCLGLVGSGRLGSECKCRAGFDELSELLRSSFGIIGRDNGTHDGHAIQSLPRGLRLVDHPLHIGVVDASDGHSAHRRCITDRIENGLSACCSNDGLGVRLAKWILVPCAGTATCRGTYVGVANMVPMPR